MNWKHRILSEADQTKIENTIAELESNSNVEIIVSILKASDPYPAASLRFAIFFTVCISLVAASYFHSFNFHSFILIQIGLIFLGNLIGQFKWAKRLALSHLEVAREVEEKANELFFTKGLNNSDNHPRILLMFSVFEHKIQIIFSPSLKGVITESQTATLIEKIQSLFKKNNYSNGIIDGLKYLQSNLLNTFEKSSNQNKSNFSNKIIWGDFS